MTEVEWLACEDPTLMLELLRGKASDRKLRLFACGCARRHCHIWESSAQFDEHWRRVQPQVDSQCNEIITIVEDDDDGVHSKSCIRLRDEIEHAPLSLRWEITATIEGNAEWWINWLPGLPQTARQQAMLDAHDLQNRQDEQEFQTFLLRDLFGNPFRPVTIDPKWLTSTVLALAQQMYESRDFSSMPILADAIQDAGCDNDDILNHCRGEGVHARGCFVVDLLLGKG